MASHTLTVLFADLAGSTQLYQTEGDVEAHQRVTNSLQRMKSVIESHSGKLLKTVGDAALASFQHADDAYLAAIGIQQEHTSITLSVRIGFHFGEVIPDDGDVYGNSVNLAARVASFAQANEICTTEDTVAQLSDMHQHSTHFLDRVNFKGMSEPMAVYRVNWARNGGETTIISAIDGTDFSKSDQALHLQMGENQIRVDATNRVVTFGRGPDNDVIVDSELASRNHAKIELVHKRFVLQDSSTNGTYLMRGDLSPEYIKRESVILDNVGSIGLGTDPDSSSQHRIEFRVIDFAT